MVLITIHHHVGRCYSNQEGMIIKKMIDEHLKSNQQVIVSFDGINGVTSSFVNTAFIELLKDYDFNFIKSHLRFVNTSKQVNEMIKDRFKFEVSRKKKIINVC